MKVAHNCEHSTSRQASLRRPVNSSENELTRTKARKRYIIWGMTVVVLLTLAGWTGQQFWFNTAISETSYVSATDIWSDPRHLCSGEPGNMYCRDNPNVLPTDTMEFYTGECDGSGTTMYDKPPVILKLPVGQLNKIDQTTDLGRGGIIVTYRPPPFGLGIFSSEVIKLEVAPSTNSPCGPVGSGY